MDAATMRPEIASPNVTEIGKTEIVVATIPQELDAAKSGFAEEIAALGPVLETVKRLVKEASTLSAEKSLDTPEESIRVMDEKRLSLYRERIKITGGKGLTKRFGAWLAGAKAFVAAKTDPIVSLAQDEETRLEGEIAKLKAEILRRENVAKAARDAEIQANVDALADVGLALPFAAVAALGPEDYAQMLADQTAKHQAEEARRASEDERAAARARLIADRRDLIEYEWMFNGLRLPEISDDQLAVMDAAIWTAWFESAKAEATRKRDAGKLRAEREAIILERELDEFFPRGDVAELTQEMFEASLDTAQVAHDSRKRQAEWEVSQRMHTERVALLIREGATDFVPPEHMADLSKLSFAQINEFVLQARNRRAEAERAKAEDLLRLRHARFAQLEKIYPGWTENHTLPDDELELAPDDVWAETVALCQRDARIKQEKDAAEALRIASERPDREKIEAWATSAIAAIPALPEITSEALRHELEACELDIRQRLDLLQVETKENV